MSEVIFKPVGGSDAPRGELVIVNATKLAKEGTTGKVAEGIYEGSFERTGKDKDGVEFTAKEFRVRGADDTLYILNSTGSLNAKLAKVTVGELVQIEYNGKEKIRKGTMKGKSFHNFEVLVASAQ